MGTSGAPTGSTLGAPTGSTWGAPTRSTLGAPTGSTSGAPTGSTSGAPTGSTSASSGPSGSTSASTGPSTSTAAPTTQSVEDLSQAASAATATKEAAAAAITAATATKEAAASVSSDLASIDLSSFLGSRRKSKRQSETTTVYPKPAQCDDIKTAMDAIANALDGTNSATYNPTKAVAIVAILKALTVADLDPACSSSDVSELSTKKESASSKAAEVVATQTNKIASATESYNEAVATINTVNEALASQGATTVEAGTTAAPVAPVTGGLTAAPTTTAPTTTATETATTLSANPTTVTDTNASGSTSTVAQTITVTASSAAVSGSPARKAALRE